MWKSNKLQVVLEGKKTSQFLLLWMSAFFSGSFIFPPGMPTSAVPSTRVPLRKRRRCRTVDANGSWGFSTPRFGCFFLKMTNKQLNLGVEPKTVGSSFQAVHVFKKWPTITVWSSWFHQRLAQTKHQVLDVAESLFQRPKTRSDFTAWFPTGDISYPLAM